jgi:hypothetical protein
VVSTGVWGAGLSWFAPGAITLAPEKTRRGYRRAGASEHLHPSLRAEHPLLIGSQDQRLLAGHVVRLGADVPFSIKEQHPQQLACGIQKVHRDDANRAVPLSRLANGLERQGKEGDRQCLGLPSTRAARPLQMAQSTSCSLSTRLNSLTLWLTTVAPMASAWQAIQRSLAPIGVARRFRAVA